MYLVRCPISLESRHTRSYLRLILLGLHFDGNSWWTTSRTLRPTTSNWDIWRIIRTSDYPNSPSCFRALHASHFYTIYNGIFRGTRVPNSNCPIFYNFVSLGCCISSAALPNLALGSSHRKRKIRGGPFRGELRHGHYLACPRSSF